MRRENVISGKTKLTLRVSPEACECPRPSWTSPCSSACFIGSSNGWFREALEFNAVSYGVERLGKGIACFGAVRAEPILAAQLRPPSADYCDNPAIGAADYLWLRGLQKVNHGSFMVKDEFHSPDGYNGIFAAFQNTVLFKDVRRPINDVGQVCQHLPQLFTMIHFLFSLYALTAASNFALSTLLSQAERSGMMPP